MAPNSKQAIPFLALYTSVGTQYVVGTPSVSCHIAVDNQKSRQGSLSEYAVVPAAAVALRPPTIDVSHASGIALAGLTAYQALFKDAGLEPGQKVFINGGSTAVGLFAIQIAKALGMTVVASASSRNEGLVKEMGADEVSNRDKEQPHIQSKLCSSLTIQKNHCTNI